MSEIEFVAAATTPNSDARLHFTTRAGQLLLVVIRWGFWLNEQSEGSVGIPLFVCQSCCFQCVTPDQGRESPVGATPTC